SDSQRIIFAKQRISRRNCWFADDPSAVHVAEVDQARDFPWLWPWRTYQNIVVICVAVNRTGAQTVASGFDLVLIQRSKILDQRAPLRFFNLLKLIANPAGPRRIPLQLAMQGGMRERLQRDIHLSEQSSQILQKLRRVRGTFF